MTYLLDEVNSKALAPAGPAFAENSLREALARAEEARSDERAKRGLFLAFQNPIAIPGVGTGNFLRAAVKAVRGTESINALAFRKELAERMTAALNQVSGISTAAAVPTLADVRDRIDERFARATGQGEIASGSIDARMLDTERSVIDREGEERLEEIRKQLGLVGPNA